MYMVENDLFISDAVGIPIYHFFELCHFQRGSEKRVTTVSVAAFCQQMIVDKIHTPKPMDSFRIDISLESKV